MNKLKKIVTKSLLSIIPLMLITMGLSGRGGHGGGHGGGHHAGHSGGAHHHHAQHHHAGYHHGRHGEHHGGHRGYHDGHRGAHGYWHGGRWWGYGTGPWPWLVAPAVGEEIVESTPDVTYQEKTIINEPDDSDDESAYNDNE